ncbi:carbohydrate-binding protein [Agarivorans aestuarii]|uniref:carbohydrate-binding protein n=1 Tax=Agarivorans aestuarii TaxID=1563703 RepID=UPI001C7FC82C|nr:carbohydrate-binding protein [Agarivorans aestuarii]
MSVLPKHIKNLLLTSALVAMASLSTAANAAIKVKAENYSQQNGVQTEPTADADGGNNVGYIENGDWVEYAINVPAGGEYTFTVRVASDTNGGRIAVLANDAEKATVKVKGTGGWQNWVSLENSLSLDAGEQTLRFNFKGSSGYLFNINWFELSAK